VVVDEADAGYVFHGTQPAPRDLVWTYMTDPALRPLWQHGVTGVDEQPTAPRRGVGTTNHCMHGADVLIEEILDWRPTDYYTLRTTLPNGFAATSTFRFADIADGTAVDLLFTWGRTRRERESSTEARDFIAMAVEAGQAGLRRVLAEEMGRRAAAAAEIPVEPEAPPSLEREIREPIRR
jgi:uncharacterized protein YndB with AHSA1/START domain